MGVFDSIFSFILFVGALVFFHELGHFLVAKACGIKVLRFSIGFGPRLFGWVRNGTDYCISALPLGGYVKMLGDTPGAEIPAEERDAAFNNKPVWKRSLVLLAGPGFNLLLAFGIYFGMFQGVQTFGDTRLGIVTVGEPAWEAGIRPGDKIIEVAGEKVTHWDELREQIASRPGQEMSIAFLRDGVRRTAQLRPAPTSEKNVFREAETRGRIGVSLQRLNPVLAIVDPNSPAAKAGIATDDVIEAVSEQKVESWHEVRGLLSAAPAGQPIALRLRRGEAISEHVITPVADGAPAGLPPDLFGAADARDGAYTGLVNKDAVIERIDDGSPAKEAGLQVGDRLLQVAVRAADGTVKERKIGVWVFDLAAVRAAEMSKEIRLTLQRGSEVLERRINLLDRVEKDEFSNKRTVRIFGAFNDSSVLGTYVFDRRVGPSEAFVVALQQVGRDMTVISKGLGKVIGGSIPFETMGGPIMLFVIAEKAAERGLSHYLRMLAMISVNLALINLLPIPVLDGGHLMFCAIEAVRRRPPSLRVRELANVVGLVLLLALMALVFRNDIIRYVLG